MKKTNATKVARAKTAGSPPDVVALLLVKVETALVEIVAGILQVTTAAVSLSTPLGDLGFDSISLGEFTNRLNERFSLGLVLPELFEHPTLGDFAVHLVNTHRDAVGTAPTAPVKSGEPRGKAASTPTERRAFRRAKPGRGRPRGSPRATEPIAIVGISGAFPECSHVKELWSALIQERNCVTEATMCRRTLSGARHTPLERIRWQCGFMDRIDEFDPSFFSMSPREAELLDPQQRLMLMHVWRLLEDAGYPPAAMSGRNVGIWVGVTASGYEMLVRNSGISSDEFAMTAFGLAAAPNRVSYLLDWHGPSEPVETACSSSLVALHRGVQALRAGDCETVIVGGVNTVLTPDGSALLGKVGLLSSDGRCKAFSKQADGFVAGEGIALLLLKPLSVAEEAQDIIYGVVRGSAVNHGGKSTSITAPNPSAQAEVIKCAYRDAGVDPRTVTYIEAHGSGTVLGDPVEINGLKMAFADLYADAALGTGAMVPGSCGLGSIKSNIGHLEWAAGIAGVIKVLLQFKHRTLVKSLHCEEINPYIDLQGSPFRIVQKSQRWCAVQDAKGRDVPLRAGVSSFGLSGVNAHIVLEEYVGADRGSDVAPSVYGDAPALIVLSGKDEERLKERAGQLLEHVREGGVTEADLADVAYTLQVGRQAMEQRLALTARSLQELQEKLSGYLQGALDQLEDVYIGEASRSSDALAGLGDDEDVQQLLQGWLQKGKYGKVLQLWVKGASLKWERLYEDGSYASHRPRRISLPTYPFAREKYWVHSAGGGTSFLRQEGGAALHPLLHRNSSDLQEQRFTTRLGGDEFYLRDHVVAGEAVLPGVAYLEMARAAVERSVGGGYVVAALKDVVWLRPVVVRQPQDIHIGLREREDGCIQFEIYTLEEHGAQPTLHAQGTAECVSEEDVAALPGAEWNVSALRSDSEDWLSPQQCYEVFESLGMRFGPAHRGITNVRLNAQTAGKYVLAHLVLPECVRGGADEYVLHPSILDSALHASLALARSGPQGAGKPLLPYALEALQVYGPTPAQGWAYIRYSAGAADQTVQKLDVDVCDESGHVCVRFAGLMSRAVREAERSTQAEAVEEDHSIQTALLCPQWEVSALPAGELWPQADCSVLLVGGTASDEHSWRSRYARLQVLRAQDAATVTQLHEQLKGAGAIDHVVWIAPAAAVGSVLDEALIGDQSKGVLSLYRLIRALLAEEYGMRDLQLTVQTHQAQAVREGEAIDPRHASVHGLVGSLAKEYGHWRIRLIDVPGDDHSAPALEQVLRVPPDGHGNAWVYREGEWYRQSWFRCELPQPESGMYAQGGVYVLIGGAGGVGEVFTEYLIRQYQAQVVWIGRREVDEAIQQKLSRLGELGPTPRYVRADATERESLQAAKEQIKGWFGRIDGLVHAAISLLDKSLGQMQEEQFCASLSSKVDVSVRLGQVFAQEALQSVVFFSSAQSMFKAAGQSNYASGCTFADAYAQELGRQWPCAVKVMNWGYWGSVGIVASEAYRERMRRQGVGSIEAAEGMRGLEQLLAAPLRQLALVKMSAALIAAMSAPKEELRQAQLTAAVEGIGSTATQRRLPEMDARTQAYMGEMEGLLRGLLLSQLCELGVIRESARIEEQAHGIAVPALYERWLKESLRILQLHEDVAVDESGRCNIIASVEDSTLLWQRWEERKSLWLQQEDLRASVNLLGYTVAALPKILTGKAAATEILFPDGSMGRVQGLYKNSDMSDYFNAVLTDTLMAYVQERVRQDPKARLRILEIGAGTGGTSEGVLRKSRSPYAGSIAQYCFTRMCRRRFCCTGSAPARAGHPVSELPTIRCTAQCARSRAWRWAHTMWVIAANVLHATSRDIRQTLQHAKSLLKGRGVLLLNENYRRGSLFTHLTFGLLEGWWRYEDEALRVVGSPALSGQRWELLLVSSGFRGIGFPAKASYRRGQQIIVAQSDGIVRVTSDQCWSSRVISSALSVGNNAERVAKENSAEPQGLMTVTAARVQSEGVRNKVREVTSGLLKIDSVRLKDDVTFSELGIDSILAVSFVREINKQFQLGLPTTIVFDHPTVAKLAVHVVNSVGADYRPATNTQHDEAQTRWNRARSVTAADPARGRLGARRRAIRPAPPATQSTSNRPFQRLLITGPGGIDDLRFEEEIPGTLGDHDVQIAVHAASFSFADLLCVKGLYQNMPGVSIHTWCRNQRNRAGGRAGGVGDHHGYAGHSSDRCQIWRARDTCDLSRQSRVPFA